jgi:hypothetical protein
MDWNEALLTTYPVKPTMATLDQVRHSPGEVQRASSAIRLFIVFYNLLDLF